MLDRLEDQIVGEARKASQMRNRIERAARRLDEDGEAIRAAARELVRSGHEETQAVAETAVRRAARNMLRRLEAG